ncbi:MAG: hypothetical protein NTX16_12155 [Actinobacteria bacterium]|nr:hypothetical protein [Actinomycetota bacterium]
MADTIDENAGVTPSEEPAGTTPEDTTAITPAAEAPTVVQTAATPEVTPAAAVPRRSWLRKRWVLITGAVAAAVVLLLGGVAIGSTIGGHDGRDGHRGADGPGHSRQGGGGFGRQADGPGHGGFDHDGDGGFGQGGFGQGGGQFGQPQQGQPQQGQPQPYGTPQAQGSTAPSQ